MVDFLLADFRADEIASALGLTMTTHAKGWKGGRLTTLRDLLVVAPWRGQHLVGIAHWGLPGFPPDNDDIRHARLESLGGHFWRDNSFPCAVIASGWATVQSLSNGKRFETFAFLPDHEWFALLARGRFSGGRLDVALVSHDCGGTSLFLPKRQPYGVSLERAIEAKLGEPLAFEPGTSPLLNADGTPDTSPPPEDRVDRRVRLARERGEDSQGKRSHV